MEKATLFLNEQDVKQCISMKEISQTIETVFRAHGDGTVVMPSKITLDMKNAGIDSWINAMPGYVGPYNIAGIKWVGGFLHNPQKNLPFIMATIILNDPQTGMVLSVMGGTYITNIRTGGAAALAAKYTADANSKIITFIGAGMQARMTLRFLPSYFKIQEVRTVDINPEALDSFKKEMEKELGFHIVRMNNSRDAVDGADIIITATQADEALVMDDWMKKGATAISLGSHQEFDENFILKADKIIVDHWEQCSHRGELKKLVECGVVTQANIFAEMGEITTQKKPGRESANERILSILVGLGTLDIAIASKVYQRALEKGLGIKFNFL